MPVKSKIELTHCPHTVVLLLTILRRRFLCCAFCFVGVEATRFILSLSEFWCYVYLQYGRPLFIVLFSYVVFSCSHEQLFDNEVVTMSDN